ncbi:MAG: hypothetical protein DMF20_05185 [Verrucomicrobia bacterium]|nr:MAG: hypothetical protein DMF20_05185 [Verrucomicrobiota bacterium]
MNPNQPFGSYSLKEVLWENLALPLPLYIDGAAVSRFHPIKIDMSLRFLIPFISVVLIASVTFAQEKSEPTADQLVAKNIEAKGGGKFNCPSCKSKSGRRKFAVKPRSRE